MAFCTKCGAQTEGRFCANCGAPVSSEAAGSSQPGAASQIAPSEGLSENLASALCYLLWFITGVLFLLLEPYSHNRTIRFHALQSILLTIAVAVIWFVWGIVASALMPISYSCSENALVRRTALATEDSRMRRGLLGFFRRSIGDPG